MNNYKRKQNMVVALIYIILTVTAVAILYPIAFVLIGSMNPGRRSWPSALIRSD